MPSRRQLLRTCGVMLPLGIAGCLGTGDDSPGGVETTAANSGTATGDTATTADETTTTSDETTTTSEPSRATTTSAPPAVRKVDPATISDRGVPTGPPVESTAEEPFLAFAVGNRDGVADPENNLPHALWLWNDTDQSRAVEFSLSAGRTTLLDETFEIPARTPLGVELRDPRRYEWTVRNDGREETGTIPRSQFDCNHSATDVLVREDELKEMTITTEMWCQTTTSGEG